MVKRGARIGQLVVRRRRNRTKYRIHKGISMARVSGRPHIFTETRNVGYIYGLSAGASPDYYKSGALTFKASDYQNVANLSAVFDEYKILKVEVSFIPLCNTMNGTSTVGITTADGKYGPLTSNTNDYYLGQLYTAIDYDDDTAPTAKSELLQYSNVKRTPVYKGQKITLVPKIQQTIQINSSTQTTAAKTSWIDMASTGVKHYGVKYFFDTGTIVGADNSHRYFEIIEKVTYACRGQR